MIHVMSAYGAAGASTRVRLHDWLRHLHLDAHHHHYAGFPDNRPGRLVRHPAEAIAAEASLRRLDMSGATLLLSREASPFSRGGIEDRLLRAARHSVFDFDDAIYLDTGGARARITAPGHKTRRNIQAADAVIAGNTTLADWASQYRDDVHVIPSCVEPDDYLAKSSWEIADDGPIVVWLGSPSTEMYVADIIRPLTSVLESHGATLRLVSGPAHNAAFDSLGARLERVPWTVDGFIGALAGADVAIAPLADTPFARGKCAYKLLQYAATGLPMVGSPVGANKVALDRFDGLAVTSAAEWHHALDAVLTESPLRRRQRGEAGLAAVREHYSFTAWAAAWTSVVGVGRPPTA